jgi:hypothetical protein
VCLKKEKKVSSKYVIEKKWQGEKNFKRFYEKSYKKGSASNCENIEKRKGRAANMKKY